MLLALGSSTMAAFGAEKAARNTFTRTDISKLSPEQFSAKVLSALAAKTTAREAGQFHPTPWAQGAIIEFRPGSRDAMFNDLCHKEQLLVAFLPVDRVQAAKRRYSINYDPPAEIASLDIRHRYADPKIPAFKGGSVAVPCEEIPDDNYFDASDDSVALRAVYAFRAFRRAVVDNRLNAVSCRDEVPGGENCDGYRWTVKNATTFQEVLSLTPHGSKWTVEYDLGPNVRLIVTVDLLTTITLEKVELVLVGEDVI